MNQDIVEDESAEGIGRRSVLTASGMLAAMLAGCAQSRNESSQDGGNGPTGTQEANSGGSTGTRESISDGETVEMRHTGAGGTSSDTVSATLPSFRFAAPVELDDTVSFTVRNIDSGDEVTVTVSEASAVEASGVILGIYNARGDLLGGQPKGHVLTPERNFETVGLAVDGDDSTFNSHERATYQATMYRDEAAVGSTEFDLIIGHQLEFESSVGADTIQYGFNAGELSEDGDLRAIVKTSEDRIEVDSVTYESDSHRFVATVAADKVPSGEHRARINVSHPDAGYTEMLLSEELSVS